MTTSHRDTLSDFPSECGHRVNPEAGAHILDRHVDGWWWDIDTNLLDMDSPALGLSGQLTRFRMRVPNPPFSRAVIILAVQEHIAAQDVHRWAWENGLSPAPDSDLTALTMAWLSLILERRARDVRR